MEHTRHTLRQLLQLTIIRKFGLSCCEKGGAKKIKKVCQSLLHLSGHGVVVNLTDVITILQLMQKPPGEHPADGSDGGRLIASDSMLIVSAAELHDFISLFVAKLRLRAKLPLGKGEETWQPLIWIYLNKAGS